jgi:hypothetical protein
MRTRFPRYIPEGSRPSTVEGVDAIAYLSERNGAFYAIGYAGKADRPSFNYRFRTDASRQAHLDNFFAGRKSHTERMAKRAAERKSFQHNVQVGDIFYTNWGWKYERTEVVPGVKVGRPIGWSAYA